MPIPSAVATSIRYRGTNYSYGTPIVFTEMYPVIEVTYDVSDFTSHVVRTYNSEIYLSADYVQRRHYGGEVVSSTVRRNKLTLDGSETRLSLQATNVDGLGTAREWDFTVSLSSGQNMSWQALGSTAIRDTLIANMPSSFVDDITEDGIVKIFWEHVDDKFTQPYVILQHLSGGSTNRSQAEEADMIWQVALHTNSALQASQFEEAIHNALTYQRLVVNATNVEAIGVIEEMTPITERYTVSNEELFLSGAIYRIMLIKG